MLGFLGSLFGGASPIIMYIRVGFIAILIAAIAAGVWYFNYSQDKIAAQATQISQLNDTVTLQNTTINNIQNDVKKANSLLIAYDGRIQQLADQTTILQAKFNSLNIQSVAKTDPVKAKQLLDGSINDSFSRIEALTRPVPLPPTVGVTK